MTGRLLGDAYIAINPLVEGFGKGGQADQQIQRALSTLNPQVRVGADTTEAKAQVIALAAFIKSQKFSDIEAGLDTRAAMMDAEGLLDALLALRNRAENIPVSTDDSKALSSIFTISAQAERLAEQLVNMKADADITPILAKYYSLDAKTNQLQADMSHLDPNMDITEALTKFATLRVSADQLNERLMSLNVDANDSQMLAKVAQLQVTISQIARELQNMPMDADTLPIEAKLLGVAATIDTLKKSLDDSLNAGTLSSVPLASAITSFETMGDRIEAVNNFLRQTGVAGSASYEALSTAVKDVSDNFLLLKAGGIGADQISAVNTMDAALKSLEADTGLTAADANKASVGFGILGRAIAAIKNTHIDLFGGALANTPLPNFLTQASGIHMLVEGVIELTAVWGPMLVGLTAFGALAYTTGKDVYTQFANMNTVMGATSAKFVGMKGGLQSLENAVQPQVMQLWGDYLTLAGNNAGHFKSMMQEVGSVLDDFGAKITMDLNSKTTSDFLEHAASDLAGVGDAFVQLGRIIGTLLEAVPGYAEMLLKFGDGFLTIAADAVSGLEPVIAIFLKVHGAIFYLGLATTAVLTLGRAMAAGAIVKNAETITGTFGSMGAAAATWATNFTSDNEKVSEAAGNSGSRIGKLGLSIGSLVGTIGSGAHAFASYVTSIATAGSFSAGASAALAPLNAALTTVAVKLGLTAAAAAPADLSITGLVASAEAASRTTAQLDTALAGLALAEERGTASAGELDAALASLIVAEEGLTAETGALDVAMDANPIGAVTALAVAAAAAIGVGLVVAFREGASAAAALNTKMEALITSSNIATIQQNIAAAMTKTTQAASAQQRALGQLTQAQDKAGGRGGMLESDTSVQDAEAQYTALNQSLNQYASQSATAAIRTGELTKQFGSAQAAAEIMTLAGVNQGKALTANASAWAEDEQKINATAAAYGFMGQQAGAAGSQLDAINITTGDATKALQTLTAAESAWITMLTGGDSAFTTFEQGQATLSSDMSSGAKSGAELSVTIGGLTEKYATVGTTLDGTTVSALAARQAFDSQLSSAATLYGSLQTLAAASGSTGAAQQQLAAGGKAIIAQMLPMAAGSKEATAELSGLAQLMGGPATDNFQTLAKWVGNTKGAEDTLNDAQAKLTISSDSLSTASKNLGNAITSEVTQMEAAKIASGTLGAAVNGLYSDFENSKGSVNEAAVSLSGEYVNALKKAGDSQSSATSALNAYLAQLGYTPGQIKEIDSQLGDSTAAWSAYTSVQQANTKAAQANQTATKNNASAYQSLTSALPGTQDQINLMWAALLKEDQALVTSGNHATAAKNQFADFAVNGLQVSKNAADELWQKFGEQNLDTLASKAGSTKDAFISMAEDGLHLTTTQATALWSEFAQQNLDTLASKGDNAKNAFIGLAKDGLDLTASQATTLWDTLKQQYLDTLASKAGETESAFQKTAAQFGLTKTAAGQLWNSLKTLADGSPYGVNVMETLSGKGKITAAVNATAISLSSPAVPGVSSTAALKAAGLAGGGVVPPGSGPAGQDSFHAMLAPGELVIPASHAPKFGAQAKAAGIPGFTSGGLVGGVPGVVSAADAGLQTAQTGAVQFTADAMTQFASAISGAFQQDQIGSTWNGQGGANLLTIARYLMANGMNRGAAAGVTSTIDGESGGNPESRGDGGWGLIGWTGNTIGLPAGYSGPTGNINYDLGKQLQGVIGYANSRGGIGPLNAAGLESAVQAGDVWSRYEAPLVPLSDTRPGLANQLYAELGGGSATTVKKAVATQASVNARLNQVKPHTAGGMISEPVIGAGVYSGMPYSFAENGQPEYVGPISGGGGNQNMMQPMTSYQGQTLTTQMAMLIKLQQQLPQTLGTALSSSAGSGVHHGFYGAQN